MIYIYFQIILFLIKQPRKIFLEVQRNGITIIIGTHYKNIKKRVKWHEEHFKKLEIHKYSHLHIAYSSNFPVITYLDEDFQRVRKIICNHTKLNRKNTNTAVPLSFKYSMLYFLHQTKDQWYIRIDDDAGIYLPNLEKAISRLFKYDSSKPIVFGNFVHLNKIKFLGGGCGYIFSRAGAKLFLDHFYDWVDTMYVQNDIHINYFRNLFNMTFADSHFPGMTSGFNSRFYPDTLELIKHENESVSQKYFSHKACLKGDKEYLFSKDKIERRDNGVKPKLIGYPLNDIFIYHHFWDFDSFNTTWDDVIAHRFPKNAYYNNCDPACHTCDPELWNYN